MVYNPTTVLQIMNVDITIMAQAPKMAPYIENMRANVAADLSVDIDCVSVKATTTEQLGFTGRGEGIAAQAVALITKNDVWKRCILPI